METEKNDKKEMEASMFKSYYVVWKPQRKAGRMGFF